MWALVAPVLLGTVGLSPAAAVDDVPPIKQRTSKSATADALPTAQINGVVYTQVVVGSTVYAGGEFTTATDLDGRQYARSNLMAYSLTTGKLATFAPLVNGTVKALAVSKDATTLFVAGNFTAVGKALTSAPAARGYFAAFDLKTKALKSMAPMANKTVNALAVTTTTVYLGGAFTKVNGVNRSRLAAVSASTGKLTGWAPVAAGVVAAGQPETSPTVQALTATPDQKKIIAGGHFYYVNGITARGMAALDAKTGARKRWKVNSVVRNWGDRSATLSLTADKDTVYGSGYAYKGGNFEGAFAVSPADGTIKWLQDCHGDTYAVAPIGDVVYSVSHAHFCSNIGAFPETTPRTFHRAMAVTKQAAGTVASNTQPGAHYGQFVGHPAPSVYNWFPDLNEGTYTGLAQGPWSVVGNSTYVALGGEFTEVNGAPQQGLVRFTVHSNAPRTQGPMDRRPTSAPWVTATGDGTTATVTWPANWDRDDRTLSYDLLRDSVVINTQKARSPFWDRPTLTFADANLVSGTRYRYQVRVSDPDGNTWTSAVNPYQTSAYAPSVRIGSAGPPMADGRPGAGADRA